MERKIYLLMGPSGAGKTTLGEYLKELGIPELVSHTTRPPRKGEINGVHYHFVSVDEFKKIELAEFNEYPTNSGRFYGISKAEIESKLASHQKVFAVAELNGIKQLKKAYPNEVVVIFITASLEEMERRMRKRGDSEEVIQSRLKQAIENKEHEHKWIADYIIENNDLEKSKEQLKKIVGVVSVS